jgi:hypothetical protein
MSQKAKNVTREMSNRTIVVFNSTAVGHYEDSWSKQYSRKRKLQKVEKCFIRQKMAQRISHYCSAILKHSMQLSTPSPKVEKCPLFLSFFLSLSLASCATYGIKLGTKLQCSSIAQPQSCSAC